MAGKRLNGVGDVWRREIREEGIESNSLGGYFEELDNLELKQSTLFKGIRYSPVFLNLMKLSIYQQ
jgi:hypothetical protein